ncbi:hypothetical protein E4U21_004754 [Claviceps maximensis]|nr:hypothetical protein E4U21_004754 [Claviceps maximensis]
MLQEDDVAVDDSAVDDDGPEAPRQSYNFAPGYRGVVYRADTPDWGAGPDSHGDGHHDKDDPGAGKEAHQDNASGAAEERHDRNILPAKYKLQSMKWGLIPSWTKRNPDYQTLMRTINCRDDSLSSPGGMWTSMKNKKRCIVLAQGFFEWLKTGGSRDNKQPHYVTRPDGRLMCFAGLWDCVQYADRDGDGNKSDNSKKLYTYTIITTDANPQLRFLHDRMPVILEPGSEDMRRWVDPGRWTWSRDLQALLRPFGGALRVYPVKKEVGKVGNNSPLFIVPLDSKENKSNIANFFSPAKTKGGKNNDKGKEAEDVQVVQQGTFVAEKKSGADKGEHDGKNDGDGDNDDDETSTHDNLKRKRPPATSPTNASPPLKKTSSISTGSRPKISSTKNIKTSRNTKTEHKSPKRSTGGAPGSRKITSFFGNSA